MSKIRNFVEITPNLPFSEFNFYELYRETFEHSELGRMKKILPLHEMAESLGLVSKSMVPKAPAKKTGEDGLPIPPYKVYNIGGGQPENLLDFVSILQEELLRAGVLPKDYDFEAHKQLVPMQPGDVPTTYADASALERDFGFTPKITLREGLRKFAECYKEYYQ